MAASWECRVPQKQEPPTGRSPFPALTWVEGTKTLAVPVEGPGMAPCTSTFKLEHLLLLPASHPDPACPGQGLVLVRGSGKWNGSPRVGRTYPCSSTDMPWTSPCHVSLPCFLPVPPGTCHRWLLPSLSMHATLTHFTKCRRKSLSPFQCLPAQLE